MYHFNPRAVKWAAGVPEIGDAKRNCYPLPHFQEGTTLFGEWNFRAHYGNDNVDTTSPTITHDDYKDLSAAVSTQLAFNAAVAAIGGSFQTWYNTLDADHKTLMRLSVAAMHESS